MLIYKGNFCTGMKGNDLTAKEHIAILNSFGDNLKLRGTSSLDSDTGLKRASAIRRLPEDGILRGLV